MNRGAGDSHMRIAQGKATVEVHLRPAAKRSEIEGFRDGILHARVKEPPREGRANEALVALVAEALGVPKRDVAIIRGFSSRDKVLSVAGLSSEELMDRLAGVPGK